MASSGVAAFGTSISPSAGEITNITGPGISVDEVEITNHSSSDDCKEFVPGLIDGGEFSVEGNLTSTVVTGVYNDLLARTSKSYTITFPNGMTWTFTGYPKSFETDSPVDGKLGFSATFRVTGKPVLAST
ncbi:phage tail tube protein [Mesotoga sp.]|uniref:phage tail tube protein n=1 Tax=Mesotoga sp. TaxID=2053577 RepID=UPI00345E5A5C